MQRLKTLALAGVTLLCILSTSGQLSAAPYAAMVIDARSGKVLHSRNADTRLHPASLTKMMTLYVVFDAVRRGEISLDTQVRVSKNAAAEPPSKLYLKAGQRIQLRYLIRASAVKSANDAATAMAEAISGSEAAFANRMTRTARALGMKDTTFKNAHGLTQSGHLSTARDMTTLGRALFYHFPDYYNLFSRQSAQAAGKTVYNTNRKLLAAYRGADGIKTGYTRAAGFNLVASAQRGNERIIATMFGGSSSAARNKRVAELLDMGFSRAPSRVAVNKPRRPKLGQFASASPSQAVAETMLAVATSIRPLQRPITVAKVDLPAETQLAAADGSVTRPAEGESAVLAASTASPPDVAVPKPLIEDAVAAAVLASVPTDEALSSSVAAVVVAPAAAEVKVSALAAVASPAPQPRPVKITFSTSTAPAKTADPARPATKPVTVARLSTSGDRHWGINVGTYASRYEAERVLLRTALIEIETLDSALRKVVRKNTGFEANLVGLDERSAALACQRLSAREQRCEPLSP